MSQENSPQQYKVFARKYRPQIFADLIGQDYLVRTLQNAIKNNQVAHSYLLTGIRGIGKTTTARIIAKALNCEKQELEPCNECGSCLGILNDNHPDVMEMDAASRTGIDDIREIIQSSSYTSSTSKYKIYIIDEVHMLSNNAFNALLKTLEEPPEHVKFIFATTEIRKIPMTILSRCQRFDLKRISNEQLIRHLASICDKENIKYTEDALEVICNNAGGSVRDSLSLLDQMRLVTQNDLTAAAIRENLGYGNLEDSLVLFELLISGEVAKLLEHFNILQEKGVDIKNLLNDLLEIAYLISKANILESSFSETKVSSEIENNIKTLANKLNISQISTIWQMLLKGIDEINNSFSAEKALEMILIRICHLAPNSDLEKTIHLLKGDLETLKKKI